MNKNMKIAIGVGIGTVTIVGAMLVFLTNAPVKRDISLKINPEKEIATTDEIISSLESSYRAFDLDSAVSIVDTNIAKLRKSEADSLVLDLIEESVHYLYQVNKPVNFFEYLRENKVKSSNLAKFMKKEENAEFVKLYDEMNKYNIGIISTKHETYINENYLSSLIVDYDSYLTKYGPYITDELKDYLMLKKATMSDIIITLEGELDYEEVLNYINRYEAFAMKYPKSAEIELINTQLHYYYRVYFGYIPASRVFDSETLTVGTDFLKLFEKAAKTETKIGEKTKKLLELLNTTESKMTPEVLSLIVELAEVDKANYFDYWYTILKVEPPYTEEELGEQTAEYQYSEPVEVTEDGEVPIAETSFEETPNVETP